MFSVRESTRLLLLLLWTLGFFLSIPEARAASLEQEPAFWDNFYDVEARGPLCWIVGYYGTILHSRDRGLNWELQSSNTHEALYRVVFVDDQRGWISGSYGTILHTLDGGKNWRPQPTSTKEHLLGLTFLNERLGWSVGSRGTILRTEDGGISWLNRSLGEDVIINDVRFTSPKHGWAVGEFGRIYQSKDGGQTWRKERSPVEVSFVSGESRNLFRLLFSDSRAVWALGLDGVILRTQNGEHWDVARQDGALPGDAKRHHLFAASLFGKNKWAVGERGTILVAPVKSDNWAPARLTIPPTSLNGIAFGHDGLGFIVGNRGMILRTEDGGKQWKPLKIIPKAPGKGVAQLP